MSTIMAKLDHQLAGRIRREREARGWSIAVLAAESGVSRAMISKVERAEASPTAALLGRLSGALGLTVSALLAQAEADAEADAGNPRIRRAAAQEAWMDPETGYRRRALSPAGAEPELVFVELPPGARITYPAASYRFLRGQVVWLQSGRLVITEGLETSELHPGDALAYDLTTPRDCGFWNPSETEYCRYLVALTRK
jgi:transcriptional regulator with XRE-family HTH domain